MRYAIFNSFPFHFEMFAHVLEYFKGHDIDVYTNRAGENGWLRYYETTYGIKQWFPISEYNPAIYDYIFLLTDDDPGPFWHHKNPRVIVTEHDDNRSLGLPAYRLLQTRQFRRLSLNWMIPVWNAPPQEKYDRLTVMAVGNAALYISAILPSLFANFSDIQFILADRNMTAGANANITTYNNLDATVLLEMAGKSHYILFWPTTGYSQKHKHDSLTASVPLAYSVGSPLILPADFADALGLQGTLGIHAGHFLTKPDTMGFMSERARLLERRNAVLEEVSRPTISVYIHNWKKVSANSLALFTAVCPHVRSTKIINSDENHPYDVPQIQLDDSFFYGGQFDRAIKDVADGEIMCVIVGDNIPTNDFAAIFRAATSVFCKYNVGVYAPNDKRAVAHVKRNAHYAEELYDVDTTDCGFWFIHPRIVRRLKALDFTQSKYGWGIDTVVIAEARKQGMLVLRDYSVETDQLDHSCGYDVRGAMYGMQLLENAYRSMPA